MVSAAAEVNSCPLQVDIDTVEKFESLRETEKQYFLDMVKQCKDSGATLIICQWYNFYFSSPCLLCTHILQQGFRLVRNHVHCRRHHPPVRMEHSSIAAVAGCIASG